MTDAWPGTVVNDSDFPGEVVEGGALPDDQYRAELLKRVQAGDRKGAFDLVRGQGIDPSDPAQIKGLNEALAAVKQGRQVVVEGMAPAAAAETIPQALYRGVGDLVEGAASVPAMLADPLGAGMNWVSDKLGFGRPFSDDNAGALREMTGAPEPVTDTERYTSAINRGGAAALATAGAGALVAGAPGMTGYVGREVAANPGKDLAAGITGAIGAEGGGDAGEAVAGPGGRVAGTLAGGLVGGVAGVSGMRKAEQAAEAFANRVPAEVALDASGNLTSEGHEMAMRAGTNEDEVVRAYARARQGPRAVPYPDANSQARREAVRARTDRPAIDPGSMPEPPQPTAEMPQQVGLNDQTVAIQQEIERRLRSGEAFDAPNAPPPAPRDPFTEAGEEGVQLTRGQAEQNFDVQNDENSLRVSASSAGERARTFFGQQQQQIQGAIERFRANFGADAGNAADRGQQLKDAVTQLRDSGAEGVRRLYREAEALGGDGLRLDTKGIHDAATDVLIDEAVPEGVKRAVSQELARYGIIGEAAPTNEAGITKVTLDDGSSVSFRGPVKQLSASNAEDLRQAVNRLYMSDPTRASQTIKPAIDEALSNAIEGAAQGEGQIGSAYGAARDAYRQQRQTFKAKDIIDNLTAVKKGTDTPVLLPEKAIAQVIGAGAEGVSNLRQVKGLLLSSGTPDAQQAWSAIQHQGLADIFDSALSRNVNHGNGQIGDVVSGAKLNSAIDKFGIDKLRTLLSPEDFNGLMKLRRIIGTATIPISGTTNPSDTATKIINYLRQGTLRFAGAIPGLGTAANAFAGLAAQGKEIAATRRTLEGITSYDGRMSTGRRLDQQARDFVREYIESGSSGRLVPSSINLSASQGAAQND